ncbi:7583_t:CDS:2 [Funneliformis geosporum]|uniref:12951_t:CDS:1 n=1 Tax=Funneliformis geosporum TaxID=1117311 RepID=A0A9W4SQN8_9GLOM|nr:7583_t:CDS:2 [Funneliformis geosporum]CAI2177907.1 12951_t:CDS:2 [Funneliformis geosporum]
MKTIRIYIILTLLISCTGILQVFVNVAAEAPKINYNGLSQILTLGQYNGISIFSTPGQRENFDITSDSFISQAQNNTFQLVGTTSYNGTINAICILPRSNEGMDVYIGGRFNTLGDISVNNIARYDPSSKTISSLVEGLDGPVYSLYCDTSNSIVYVGGTFVTPTNPMANNINATDFAGSVAVWRDETWVPLPFKGFNGPVYTIAYNEPNNTIYFGGQFDATGDGRFGVTSNTQPINIQKAVITGGNSADRDLVGDPSSVLCNSEPDGPGTTWLMRDGMPGFWRAEFNVKLTPSVIGIKNTNFEGRGTKTFRLIATADMSVVTLSYMDPIKGLLVCTSCPLSPSNEDFQTFTFVSRPELTGIQIDILEWYGIGGGFHGIKLFQSDIIVRAVSDMIDNNPSCGGTNPFQPKVTFEGLWTSKLLSGIWQNVLQTIIPAGEIATSTAKVIMQPYIPQAGYYDVSMVTPSCIPYDCSKTISIDVRIMVAPGQTIGPIPISQNNPSQLNRVDVLASGLFIVATTTFFQPTVEITISTTAAVPVGGEAIVVVDSIKFVKSQINLPLSGLFQYSPASDLNEPAWNGFNGVLAPLSTVHTIKVISPYTIVIGGKFNNVTFFNIVEYDGNTFIPLPNGGLNGRVNTLEKVDDNLLVGGLFNNTVLGLASLRLENLARLSISENQWYSVAGGVNGEVGRLTLLNNNENQQVHVAGKFNTAISPKANEEGIIYGNVTFGYSIWDNKFSDWATSSYIDGVINDIVVSGTNDPSTFYAGRISAAQLTTAFGGSFITSTGISALPIYPQALDGNVPEIIINTGLIWNDTKNDKSCVIIGGKFEFNGIKNVAIMVDGLWNSLGDVVFEGEVISLDVTNDLLYIGSAFTVTNESDEGYNAFVIYDLYERKVIVSPQLTADDNNVKVNVIRDRTGTPEIIVGGKFDKAGSLECKTICIWDSRLKQWKPLGAKDDISGEIFSMDLIGKMRNKDPNPLVVAGNLTLNGKPVYLLKYDFSKSSWEDMSSLGSDNNKLPGIATVVSNDFMIDGQFFVSGHTEVDGSAYLCKWTGDEFRIIGKQIMSDSKIEALTLLPSNNEHENVDYLGDKWLLLVSGSLKLDTIGDVSAALYDGKDMYPYILSSQTNGVSGRITAIFITIIPELFGKRPLPVPLVILVSIAIALSLVFLIVASGMTYRYYKNKHRKKPTPLGLRESMKTPIRDSEIMATIQAAAAIIGQGNRYSMASSNNQRNSVFGSNADVKSLDEVASSGFIASGPTTGQHYNQAFTLQNNSPKSIDDESIDSNLAKGLAKATSTEQAGSAKLRPSTQLHSVVITPGEGAPVGQVLSNGEAYEYIARYPFNAREEGELDSIFVLDTNNEVWWFGYKLDQDGNFIQGVFPSNYVVLNQDQINTQTSES